MADAESVLTPLKIPEVVKADAFDAYHAATSTDDLTARLKKLPLTDSQRADLWDAAQTDPKFVSNVTADGPRSFLQKAGDLALHNPITDTVAGVGSGVVSTGLGAYKLARMIPGMDKVLPAPGATFEGAAQAPDTFMGKTGKFVEQAGEFLVPMGEVGAAFKAAEAARVAKAAAAGVEASRFLPAVAKIGTEAATAGATTAVQTGGDPAAIALSAGTAGVVGAGGAAIPAGFRKAGVPLIQKLIDNSPRPLSQAAQDLADKLGVPLTRGMVGGSKTIQAVEKTLGHSVAGDIYEPLLEKAQQGVNAGAQDVSGGFATDKFTAGSNTIRTMITAAKDYEDQAGKEYANLAQLEADPANTRSVQVGMKNNPSPDPTLPNKIPDMQDIGLPVDMRPAKQVLAPEVEEISRRMTDAQRRSDPGLAAIKNILTRPDHLPASVAEADLSYLKEILRSDATGQAKRLAGKAISAMEPEVQSAIAQAGPKATVALNDARGAWQARSEILAQVKSLSGDAAGKKGQVMFANKLLQPADASFPALEKVLQTAPDAADDLGKAYLTERVFKSAASGENVSAAKAINLWGQIGSRTKEALYTPEQITNINDFLELAKRVAENPNPSGTGIMNTLLKMGVMVTHPGAGAAGFALGRNLAKVLYSPEGAANLRIALENSATPRAAKAMLYVRALLNETETANTPRP